VVVSPNGPPPVTPWIANRAKSSLDQAPANCLLAFYLTLEYNCSCVNQPTSAEKAVTEFDRELDASGLNCPLPILRAKKALTDMASGQVLKVISTDQGSVKDFEAFCKQTNNPLLSSAELDGKFVFMLKKT
jgi:tRNA 2-thiouridine synthesizing protein A